MELRNRLNQAVNLEATVAFDETTSLTPYTMLPFNIELPSKGIILQDNSTKDAQTIEQLGTQITAGAGDRTSCWATIEIALDDKNSELGNYGFSPSTTITSDIYQFNSDGSINPNAKALPLVPVGTSQQLWNGTNWQTVIGTTAMTQRWFFPDYLSPVINYQETTLNYAVDINPGLLEFLIEGEIEPLNLTIIGDLNLFLLKKDINGIYTFLSVKEIYATSFHTQSLGANLSTQPFSKVRFSHSFSNPSYVLNKGDEIFLFIGCYWTSENSDISAGINDFKITIDSTSYFIFKTLSHTPATKAKVYAVNEIISRIAESITEDKLRAYSEYFGRTDSQPYAVSEDGCGSLEVLTDGLRIRQQENRVVTGTTLSNIFSLSLKDVFEGLNPIHNI